MTIFNFNRSPKPETTEPVQETAQKIDELATKIETERMRLYDERFSASEERKNQINERMKVIEKILATLKRDGKIPDLNEVRKELAGKELKLVGEEEVNWGQEGRDAARQDARKAAYAWNEPGATGGDTGKDLGQSQEGPRFRS